MLEPLEQHRFRLCAGSGVIGRFGSLAAAKKHAKGVHGYGLDETLTVERFNYETWEYEVAAEIAPPATK